MTSHEIQTKAIETLAIEIGSKPELVQVALQGGNKDLLDRFNDLIKKPH